MKEYNKNPPSCFFNFSIPPTFARGHTSQDSTKKQYNEVIDKIASMNKIFISNNNQDKRTRLGELLSNSSLPVQNGSSNSFRINECINNLSSPQNVVEIMSRNCHRFISRWGVMNGDSVHNFGWRPVAKHGPTNNVLDREWSPDGHKKKRSKDINLGHHNTYIQLNTNF